ncbi:glycine--tRNA ligase subunit beta [Hippea jasoniae]|uniref:glycine--tRNA ligase subunit beta n=1 Tax=Hippea jasoniae TaxID=944479 RepID=UPI00068B26AD|nr:glycine--tRNA ligase subunit beta [Hippea jasoniae]
MKLLFELFTEELPNSEMVNLESEITENLKKLLEKNSVSYSELNFYMTPRRIAIKFKFDETIKAEDLKVMGPPKNICFDKDGNPTKALEGFLKKNNATKEDIVLENTKKGEYVAIVKKGQESEAKPIVVNIMDELFKIIHLNKQMRWGEGEFEFVRPVHGVVFLIDDAVVDFEFKGKKATSKTYGHRFLSEGSFEVNFDNYEDILNNHYVIVDHKERRKIIFNQLNEIAKKYSAKLIYDDDLLDEVVNLTEYPTVVVGRFEDRFLKLPKEVLITSMKDHQRYFSFLKEGKLLNIFAAVSNIKTQNMDVIINGYERVLRARFSDAEFFFEEDKKKPLESFVEKLDEMMFHEKLGSQLDRTNRLVNLAGFIAEKLEFDVEKAKRAAYLSKADLLTQMVYEFPELQGVMGKEYALLSGEDKEVAEAIYEQYLPKEDEIPKTASGIALSIADKIDIIVGGFYANLKPTGAKDPYGLRRAALGIIRTLIDNRLFLNLDELIDKSKAILGVDVDNNQIKEFIKTRFINYLSDYPFDILTAASDNFEDIYETYLRVKALSEFAKKDTDKKGQYAIKRIFNIVKDFDDIDVDTTLLKEKEEKELFEAIKGIEENIEVYAKNRAYLEILNSVAAIENTISRFFDNVMVMDKDEKIKNNRLSLLNRIRKAVLNVGNFKYLEI